MFNEQLHTPMQTTKKHKPPKGTLNVSFDFGEGQRDQYTNEPMGQGTNEAKGPRDQWNTGPMDQKTSGGGGGPRPKTNGPNNTRPDEPVMQKLKRMFYSKAPLNKDGGHACYAQSYNNPPWQW